MQSHFAGGTQCDRPRYYCDTGLGTTPLCNRNWAIPDKNRTAPRMTNRLSAVVSFDTGNIQGNLLIVQGNLFRCHPWGCTIFIWNSPLQSM